MFRRVCNVDKTEKKIEITVCYFALITVIVITPLSALQLSCLKTALKIFTDGEDKNAG